LLLSRWRPTSNLRQSSAGCHSTRTVVPATLDAATTAASQITDGTTEDFGSAGIGCQVAAIGRGSENAPLAKKLGASLYIDSKATNAAEELQKLGGAQVILATAPSSKAMSELIDGLGPNGKLIVIGAAFDPIEVTPMQLISRSRTIQGWASGTPADMEDTLRFAELTGVRPMIGTYPLEKAAEAYARMMSGNAQFRVVLTL
jgi:D-arabinose 1-dehydrogenase-like Zn-dependent alcohol dehydrogenase